MKTSNATGDELAKSGRVERQGRARRVKRKTVSFANRTAGEARRQTPKRKGAKANGKKLLTPPNGIG